MARTKRTNAATLVKMAQLAVAAPQVVAIRTSRMLAAGANPGAADRAEFSRMHTEKVQAYWEAMFGMATQASLQWLRLWTTPFSSSAGQRAAASIVTAAVKPVHKRATANARRLGRRRRS